MKKIVLLLAAAILCSCSSVDDVDQSGQSASSYKASDSYARSARFGLNHPDARLTPKSESIFDIIFKPFQNDDLSDHNTFIYR